MNGTICASRMELIPFGHLMIYFSPMLINYCICLFCAYKVYRLIKNHQSATAHLNRKFYESKDIVRLVVIEITVPVTLSTPILICCFLVGTVDIPRALFYSALSLFVIHATTDPIIVVFVLKPYRKALLQLWTRVQSDDNESLSTRIRLTDV